MKEFSVKKVWKTTKKKQDNNHYNVLNHLNDKIKWVLASFIFLGSIIINVYIDKYINNYIFCYLIITMGILLSFYIFSKTRYINKFLQFIPDIKLEIQKISWPNIQDVLYTSLFILLLVFISAIIIHLLGIFFIKLIKLILI